MLGSADAAIGRFAERLDDLREEAQGRHRVDGADAVARALAAGIDCLLAGEAERALGALREGAVLLAVGRYGRRHLNLRSRVPAMLVLAEEPDDAGDAAVRAFLDAMQPRDRAASVQVWIAQGLAEGLAKKPLLGASLAGARAIWGKAQVYTAPSETQPIVAAIAAAVAERHAKHGNTPFLLEPDLRDSPGAVEDAELPLVLAALRGEAPTFEGAVAAGVLAPEHAATMAACHATLLEFRNGLHALEGARVDELRYERQMRLSAEWDAPGFAEALPEENLMRAWYACADPVHELAGRALRAARSSPASSVVAAALVRPLPSGFRVAGDAIDVDADNPPTLDAEGSWLLEIFRAAAEHRLGLTDGARRFVEGNLPNSAAFRTSPRHRDLFLAILRACAEAPRVLREMHRTRALEAYLPEFAPVRHLPKIDHYHQFTLDEHILRAVDAAGAYCAAGSALAATHAGGVAASLLRPDLLLFAALLHDTGKGEGRAHVIRGARIAEEVANRIGLSARECETLRLLVMNHHRMSHIALRRNLNEPGVREELANDLPDAELLAMLYVLTCCDLRAVSSSSWNEWRGCLLARLHDGAIEAIDARLGKRRESDIRQSMLVRVLDAARAPGDDAIAPANSASVAGFLLRFPEAYRLSTPERHVARHLAMSTRVGPSQPLAWEIHPPENGGTTTLHVACEDAPGLLRQLSGAVYASGFRVAAAQCFTSRDRLCVDVFHLDPWEEGDDLAQRLEGIMAAVAKNLRGRNQQDWVLAGDAFGPPVSEALLLDRPPEVAISNGASNDGTTTVEVSAPARAGFLFRICKALDERRTHVAGLRLDTEDYVTVAVLSVTDWENNRLEPGPKTDAIREALLLAATPPRTLRSSAEVRKL